ncbi:MAG: polyribonucleotide nucleotidyltransferase, partial [Chloroflexota bacterium]|nr:polyribonucleotide nucleotidyltransferase [Chloroflexota bacterium]
MPHTYERDIDGRALIIETGRLAGQANGAVTVRCGDTVVLVTACLSPQLREGVDFLPLTIDYEERLYAAGKIPGGWFRREGRPSAEAILAARLTDRPLRPLFPKGFRNDIQVIITVLSADQENDPDILATIGASTALCMSDIPFDTPISAARVGHIDGQYVANPTFPQLKDSLLDLVVASTRDAVVMVEGGARLASEDTMLRAVAFGHQVNQQVIALQEEVVAAEGRPKLAFVPAETAAAVHQAVSEFVRTQDWDLLANVKEERDEALAERRQEVLDRLGDIYPPEQVLAAFDQALKQEVRQKILHGIRPDGRKPEDIRTITCDVGLLPRTHGSGLFSRGQTQVLTIATLGSVGQQQRLDGLEPEETKRFLHHYNFPPFSVGEVRRLGIPSRREVGHGLLAERALEPVIPSEEDFPYTIRLVSEVLSSNGSTSMASVCGSTLSLMDAGVPIKAPVAGVAMGLVMGEDGQHVILTDIAGVEDALGDMDFKVAGTAEGITALQMDIKVKGITIEILEKALAQARQARLYILDRMRDTISQSRPELSRYAPRMYRIQIPQEKIGQVIGPGGRVIRSIIEETKCSVDVEDDGTVFIGSSSEEMAQRAISIIEGLTKEVAVGEIFTGKVTRLTSFGAFVEILPGKDGLVRLPDLAEYEVTRPDEVVRVGDEVMVMVIEVDHMGRINLSRRAVMEGAPAPRPPAPPAPAFRDRGERAPFRSAYGPSAGPSGGRPRPRGDGRPMPDRRGGRRPPPP